MGNFFGKLISKLAAGRKPAANEAGSIQAQHGENAYLASAEPLPAVIYFGRIVNGVRIVDDCSMKSASLFDEFLANPKKLGVNFENFFDDSELAQIWFGNTPETATYRGVLRRVRRDIGGTIVFEISQLMMDNPARAYVAGDENRVSTTVAFKRYRVA